MSTTTSLSSDSAARGAGGRALRVLAEAGDLLTASLEPGPMLEAALRLLVPHLASFAIVGLVRDGVLSDEIFAAHADATLNASALDTWRRVPSGERHPLDRVIETRSSELLEIDDAAIAEMSVDDTHREALAALGMKLVLLVPLLARGRPLGAMAVAWSTTSRESIDMPLVSELARRIGGALETAMLLDIAERRGAQLERLQTFTAALAAGRTLTEVVEVILSRGRVAFGAQRGVVCLLARDGAALEVAHAVGYDHRRDAWPRMPLASESPLTDAVRLRKPLFFAHRSALIASYPALADRRDEISEAVLVLPLMTPARALGCVGLGMSAPRQLNPEDEADLMSFAWLCAQAIERAVLFDVAEAERQRAEEANRMKDELFAVLSHEMRTPLNAILGWAKMLSSGTLEGAQATRAVTIIERNARAQAQLVDELLDVSRIVTGKLRLKVEEVVVARVIEAAADVVRPAAAAKDVTLDIAVDESVTILGDGARLQQIAWNLLSNAVKFTERGGRVALRLALADEACVIVIEDSGQGIAPEFLPFIFERFRQADMGSSRAHGGLGLGLAIVRHLVELHGGTVEAHSEGLGQGARFVLSLPIAAALRKGATAASDDETCASSHEDGPTSLGVLAGLHVLVVDDESDARELVSTLLEQRNVRVSAAGSVTEALELVARDQPDVIVSDIAMPGEDGYALIARVRALPNVNRATPAVALTAYARAEDRTRALHAGFDAHVAKPVEPAQLVLAIAEVSGRCVSRPS